MGRTTRFVFRHQFISIAPYCTAGYADVDLDFARYAENSSLVAVLYTARCKEKSDSVPYSVQFFGGRKFNVCGNDEMSKYCTNWSQHSST